MIITSTSIRQLLSKWDGKLVWHTELGAFHGCKWKLASLLEALILHLIDVPPLGIGCVYITSTISTMLHGNVYDVIVRCYLVFILFYFVSMLSSFIGKKGNMSHASVCISSLPKGCILIQRLISLSTNQHQVKITFIICSTR
jgi:hypothetical protein